MDKVVLVEARDWQVWSQDHDAVIIDVREPFEWAMGTLPGAELIGLGSLFARIEAENWVITSAQSRPSSSMP